MLVDSHCHLNFSNYDKTVDELLVNAINHKVNYFLNVGTKPESQKEVINQAEKYSNIFATVGVHPVNVGNYDLYILEELKQLLNHEKVVALGEIGLDYYYVKDEDGQKKQLDFFETQCEIAKQYDLPVCIHSRDAKEDTLNVLTSAIKNSNLKGVYHCYSYDKDYAKKVLDMGFYFGLGGVVTFKNALELQEVAKYVPLSNILLETDSPYLAPTPMRGKVNEPAYTFYIAEFLAKLRNVDFDIIAEVTTNNFFKLYKKAYR